MENDFAKPLAAYWARLESTVHPDDVPIMDAAPREINFDFPPPAFIGDILHAKVFVLVGNGGYDCRLTPKEFAAAGSAELYRRRLAEPSVADVRWTSPYYLSLGTLTDWLCRGSAAIVNGLAYRSEETTGAVVEFAKTAPSSQFHRRWFEQFLAPAAEGGLIRIVAHRPRLWNLSGQPQARKNIWVLPSHHSARKLLSMDVLKWASQPPTMVLDPKGSSDDAVRLAAAQALVRELPHAPVGSDELIRERRLAFDGEK